MKVLISPVSLEEARVVAEGGADVLDIKNTNEGSLGAQAPWILQEIVQEFKGSNLLLSATLGDLPYKPGTAALAAFGCAHCGVDYVKAGLHGATNYDEAYQMMDFVTRSVRMVNKDIFVVASGYADFRRFGGAHYADVVRASKDAGADIVMVDTAIKDGKTLTDVMSMEEIQDFVQLAKDADLLVALAGSVKLEHIEPLAAIGPHIVGVRGAVCDTGDRKRGITRERVEDFMGHVRKVVPQSGDIFGQRRAATA